MGNKVFSCQLCRTKKAWPTYVYPIWEAGPLPQAVWMSNTSLLATKVLCVHFFFLYMFAFIIFHSSSLSNVDKILTSLYIRGSSSNHLQLQKLQAGEGFQWAEIWQHRFCPTSIHSHHRTASHHCCPPASLLTFIPPSSPFSLLHPEWSGNISLLLSQSCCPSLLCLPQSLCVALSDWLMLHPLAMSIPWCPFPHGFPLIYQILALMAPPLTGVPISTPSVFLWHRLVYSYLSIYYIL